MWAAAFDVVSFPEAVDWFARRTPITDGEFARNVEQAHRQAFWIAGVTRAEVIRSVFDDMKRALEQGIPFDEWQKTVGPKLEREWLGYGLTARQQAFRTELVLRNWSQGAYNRARWAQMNEPSVKRFRPYALFDGVKDSHQSEICRACNDTCLPLDDPWWDGHRPPLHHACRSGIRNLTRAAAEARGITKKPTDVGAAEGFGSGGEYKGPDRRKFGNAPKPPPPPPKVPKPPRGAPPPPPPPPPPQGMLRRRADELASALEQGRDGEARTILREVVQEAYPGSLSRDLAHGRPGAGRYSTLTQDPGGGHHGWDGEVALGHEVKQHAARALRRIANGEIDTPEGMAALFEPLKRGEDAAAWRARRQLRTDLGSLRTLIHEEVHGHSRMIGRTYRGAAAVIEEVGTEISSRVILRNLTPAWRNATDLGRGSYEPYIGEVESIISKHSGLPVGTALRERMAQAHARGVMGQGPDFAAVDDQLQAFTAALDLTEPQRNAVLHDLRQLRATHLPSGYQ